MLSLVYTTAIVRGTNEDIDMLIFISPQYSDDQQILNAINNYINAIKDDIDWKSKVLKIEPGINDYKKIDQVIESYYNSNSLKACIMVGEDIDTALSGDIDFQEIPSTVPWYTTGLENGYTISEAGVHGLPYEIKICISLIYPTSDLDYTVKASQIISAFNKFANNRDIYFKGDVLAFLDSGLASSHNGECREIYQNIGNYCNLYYKEDPTQKEVVRSLLDSYSMYFIYGHSCPSYTELHPMDIVNFYASYLDYLDVPFFGASGCYVGGWWSNELDNNALDPSITREDSPHYSSRIFTSTKLQVMVLGKLYQTEYNPYTVSFITNVIPDLVSGMTLADAMIGKIFNGDCQTVIGDPTFDFRYDDSVFPSLKITKPDKGLYIFNIGVLHGFFEKPLIIGDIDITVDMDDSQIGVKKVEFYVDEELKSTDTKKPYSWTWDERGLLKHNHIIKVAVSDWAGNIFSKEITVWKFF